MAEHDVNEQNASSAPDSQPVAAAVAPKKTAGLGKMMLVLALAFAFTFSLVPIYRIACEKLLGIRFEREAAIIDEAKVPGATLAADGKERVVRVEFDGSVNSHLPWSFRPNQHSMEVVVGKPYETTYFAQNQWRTAVVGSATPSVAPARASAFFNKTECFCFTAQTLQAGEKKDMPVRFIIDPALPKDIKTITLSYTFFKNDMLTDELKAQSPHAKPAGTSSGANVKTAP